MLRILPIAALALLSLATCQVQVEAPIATQASSAPALMLPQGPVDTGGFLIYSPPTAAQPKRFAGAYWRQRELDAKGSVLRENVRRWTLRSVEGLDLTKVVLFNVTDPVLSESAGPYILERVKAGNTQNELLDAVAEAAGVRPTAEKSDTHFLFWGFTGEVDKAPSALVSSGR